jgi:hypothetical protein
MTRSEAIPAAVLAGGKPSPEFVAATGVAHRALLRVPGRGDRSPGPTMLEVVIGALQQATSIADISIVSDLDLPPGVRGIADHGGFVENVFAALGAHRSTPRVLLCTADTPFLTATSVEQLVKAGLGLDADLVYPIVRADVCARAYPGMRRTSLPTREGRFTGGNLVLVRPAALLAARAHIEAAHAKRKSPLRLAMMLGLGATFGVALSVGLGVGLVSIGSLERAASNLMKAKARALVSNDPAIATDVDRIEDVAAMRAAITSHD